MRTCALCACVVASGLAIGCAKGNPASPSQTLIAPTLLTPANGALVPNASQPLTLVAQNPATTSTAAMTYTFEVATDPNFTNKVQTKDQVPQGTTGQTTVKLDTLPPGATYYWHARVVSGSTTGVYGSAFTFAIGSQVVLSTPVAVGPLNGANVQPQPTLTVTNVVRIGPSGLLTYKFEIADSAAFTSIVNSGTVNEGSGTTSYTSSIALLVGRTYFWRVTAIDATNATASSPSTVLSFTTTPPTIAGQLAAQEGLQLWPGVQPGGSSGHAAIGNGWDVQNSVSFNGVAFTSPGIDELRVLDLVDRGYDVFTAIGWMNSNGYPTSAVAYNVGNNIPVVGFAYDYIALDSGVWDLVHRSGA